MDYNNCSNIYISKSEIDGYGIFTNVDIKKNEKICYAIKNKKITDIGSKINHCEYKKNVDLFDNNDDNYYFIATEDIKKNDELLINYMGENIPYFIDKNTSGFKYC